MCDEFDSGAELSDAVSADSDVSWEEGSIDFEVEGIFDTPQDDVQSDLPNETPEDVYEASTLDEIEILEDSGDTHTVAERIEELYGENPIDEELTPALEGLQKFEEGSSAERLEEIQEQKEGLENLKAALLAGDANALDLFGLETPNTSEEEGHQKVLTR